jgi:hypothetical protein
VTRRAGELLSGAVGDVLNVFEQGDRHLWIVQDSVQVTAVDCDVLCRNADFAVIGGDALFEAESVNQFRPRRARTGRMTPRHRPRSR